MFAWTKATGSREETTTRLEQERGRIQALVQDCGEEAGARRVLIKRLPGMEDSSRFWSVWMTLEHLRIVHQSIANTIRDLGNGIVPSSKASTAAVKPHPEAEGSARQKFDHSCELILQRAALLTDLHTAVRYAHPWFGPLDAYGWYALVPFHLKLHRTQLEQILASHRKA